MTDDFAVIGKPLPKVDGMAKCTGQTKFADDLNLSRMLFGRLLRSVHAHALIKRIDATRAERLPGVHAVITGKDLPIKFGILPVSQDEETLAVDKVRYVGDPVAAVAAIDEETAERALEYIDIEYEPLPAIMSIQEALAREDVRIHDYGDGPNIHKMVSLEFGDVEEGFAEAHHVREDTFFFEGSNHLPMEQHAAVASYEADGKLTVWSATQTPHYVHRALEKVLEHPASQIRVIATPVGGGFGGKSDPFSHEIAAAKLSMLTGRPVKITCTREEVFYIHRGRHPVLMWVKTGFARDGRITAMHFKSFLDGGAYGSYGVASTYYTGALQTTTYKIPRYKFEGLRVFTNKPPCGPKRGHGTPQPRYALECHLDKVAAELGIDPVELRRRNAVEPFSTTVNYLRITSCRLQECIDKVVEASGFREKHGRLPAGRGMGFGISAYLCGAGLPIYWNDMPQSEVQIKIDRGGGVTVYSMAIDIGQGSDSVLVFIVAEVLGIEPSDIKLVTADTDLTPIDLGSYSSRVTFMAGNAAVEAAQKVRATIFEAAAEKLQVPAVRLMARGRRVYDRENPEHGLTWVEAIRAAEARVGLLAAVGSYRAPKLSGPYKGSGVGPSPAYSYSASVVQVKCDPQTGAIVVEKVWIAHDVGRSINPILVAGQVEGSVYMALGEVLMEEQTFRRGVHKFPSMLEYKSPTTLETPEMQCFIVESVDPEGPFGAKEAGQGPLLPVIPAVANAVADALGIRIDEIPITPEKVLAALADRRKGGPGRVGPREIPKITFKDPIRVELPPGWQKPVAVRP
ncbi:MAG: molybdopterin cofactor-binding domain-containing protein [Armatimonadota bacterium]